MVKEKEILNIIELYLLDNVICQIALTATGDTGPKNVINECQANLQY